jgi:hypothetical protein
MVQSGIPQCNNARLYRNLSKTGNKPEKLISQNFLKFGKPKAMSKQNNYPGGVFTAKYEM